MRDSNHSFPSLNRACVSISSSLYDRRAIDSPVPTLPLLTSLQHLAYLTSTSPRIREILTVDGGLERLISIVETCIDLAYPERARSGPSRSSSASFSSSSSTAASTSTSYARSSGSSKPTSTTPSLASSRKGKWPERQNVLDEALPGHHDDSQYLHKKLVPFKAFSAYANYPFSVNSDSDDDEREDKRDDSAMDITPSNEDPLPSSRRALNQHEREIKLLQLEKSFMRSFISDYKDLPALVHTYGFALQCLVNVGVRGSESIRTRVVEAGVLGVVARILGGFLDYRATEREKRQKIISAAQAEKEREKESSFPSSSSHAHTAVGSSSRRERHAPTNNTSGDSDTTAVLSMSTRRERRERDAALVAAQAQTLASAQAQIGARQHEYSLTRAQTQAAQDILHPQQNDHSTNISHNTNNNNHTAPLVAGMAAPPNATAANTAAATLATPRQTRSAAVQALLNSNTEIPTRALHQNNTIALLAASSSSSTLPATIPIRVSPRRAGSSSSIASSTFQYQPQQALSSNMNNVPTTSLLSSSLSNGATLGAISSLAAGSIHINRTNTPDTIASVDEVQEFSDVNPDENESTTSSAHDEGSAIVDIVMDGIGASETELQSTSDLVLGSTMASNPASRSVSRNRINGNILAQHRPLPPPSSSSLSITTNITTGTRPTASQDDEELPSFPMDLAGTQVQAPAMVGDVTIKLSHGDGNGATSEEDGRAAVTSVGTEDDEDVVMERENEDREDQEAETTDDTGTSASPISRPASSQYIHRNHHPHHHPLASSPSRPAGSYPRHPPFSMPTPAFTATAPAAHVGTAQDMARSDSTTSSLNAMVVDCEATPIPRPVPLRRQSISAVTATPRNAFISTTVTQNVLPHSPQSSQNQHNSAPVSYNYLSHAAPHPAHSEAHSRSSDVPAVGASASATAAPQPTASSSTATSTRQPHTSTHVHLRLHPHLQQTAATQPSVMRDGHAHLLLNYGPLMDHFIKEEDVLHCLHLLAYLSKYPHVRAVFHDPENEICKPSSSTTMTAMTTATGAIESTSTASGTTDSNTRNCCSCARKKLKVEDRHDMATSTGHDDAAGTSSSASAASLSAAEDGGHQSSSEKDGSKTHSRSTSSGSHKHSHPCCADVEGEQHAANDEDREEAESLARARAMATMPAKDRKPALEPSRPPRSTANNVFSLVEQYTFRPSSPADRSMRLGTDIQYWAGVIMRNACRKDELRGGIRQCANMGCGVWERFPREFAKCRRCRKAKYCSKGCQRRAWQAGHRYWCSARQDAPPTQASGDGSAHPSAANENATARTNGTAAAAGAGSDNDEEIEGVLPVAAPVAPPDGTNPNTAAAGGNPAGVMDGITVDGEDGNHHAGGFDARIRMGAGNEGIRMLDGM